jgi:hypothetical protein
MVVFSRAPVRKAPGEGGESMSDDHAHFLNRAEHYEKALAELKLLKWGYFAEDGGHIDRCPEIQTIIDDLESTIDRIGLK